MQDQLTRSMFEEFTSSPQATFIKPKELISDLFARQIIDEAKYAQFCTALDVLGTDLRTGEANSEHEAFFQDKISKFLASIGYRGKYDVAPTGRSDLAIHHGSTVESPVACIIEVKRPSNKTEMCSLDNLNVKALHEALAYEFKEVIEKQNYELQTLIVTNGWEWYFFDAGDIWQALNRNTSRYKKLYQKFISGNLIERSTDFLYKSVLAPAIADLLQTQQLICCHISLSDFFDKSNCLVTNKRRKLQEVFKVFSPETLIGRITRNDANVLNKEFYHELLYIVGLEEVKAKIDGQEKFVIRRIVGKKRQYHSLLESAIRLSAYSHPGLSEEELFEPALEIVLLWINRIIFLKLLETQLVNYHDGDERYKFLAPSKFSTFDEIADLFFGVLAAKRNERNPQLRVDFGLIPYLNSSLFELSDIEREYVRIGEVKDGKMDPFSKTVLVDKNGKTRTESIRNLEYLLTFLDSYDFGIAHKRKGAEESEHNEPKQLISASVLGLIYEKINGYKDGSVFTPGVITSFMCKRILRDVVRQKLNKVFNADCQDWNSLCEYIKEEIRAKSFTRKDVSQAINSIHILDLAVGSGHFLVSVLNQLIVIKNDLRVLVDEDGKTLDIDVLCLNDELVIYDENGQNYQYKFNQPHSANIQKSLFLEKQSIIENCLFGVDINPKSVQICRLRLWTELLKNAYYQTNDELQTLPNIDINIRTGNSLISRIQVNPSALIDNKSKSPYFTETLATYKVLVKDYIIEPNKRIKRDLMLRINDIKSNLANEAFGQLTLDGKDNTTLKNTFEWAIEFPEVLNDNGDFQGFDCILANPPYMRIQALVKSDEKAKKYYDSHYAVATGSYDLANLFIERAMQLSARDGLNSFIFPHKFLNTDNGSVLRNYLMRGKHVSSLVHFGANQVFEDVTTYTCILNFSPKASDSIAFSFFKYKEDYEKALTKQISTNAVSYKTITEAATLYGGNQWILFPTKIDEDIFRTIYEKSFRLGDAVNIFQGIPTSKDDLYILEKDPSGVYTVPLTGKTYALEDEFIKPYIRGKDVKRFESLNPTRWIFFPYQIKNDSAVPVSLDYLKEHSPETYRYLMDHETEFKARESGKAGKLAHWYSYLYPKSLTKHGLQRLSSMEICSKHPNVTFNDGIYHGTKVYSWIINDVGLEHGISNEYLLAIANSKLLWWFLKLTGDTLSSDSRTFKTNYLAPFPLPLSPDQELKTEIENLVKDRLSSTDETQKNELENKINEKVCLLYGLSEEQAEVVTNAY